MFAQRWVQTAEVAQAPMVAAQQALLQAIGGH